MSLSLWSGPRPIVASLSSTLISHPSQLTANAIITITQIQARTKNKRLLLRILDIRDGTLDIYIKRHHLSLDKSAWATEGL